jgi:hypothetical protein
MIEMCNFSEISFDICHTIRIYFLLDDQSNIIVLFVKSDWSDPNRRSKLCFKRMIINYKYKKLTEWHILPDHTLNQRLRRCTYWTIFVKKLHNKILHKDILLYVLFSSSKLLTKVLLEFISVSFFSVILYLYALGLITISRYRSYATSFTYIT